MRAHSAIFPLDLVSRQGKYLYTVHEFTKLTQLQAIHWTILVSFVQGILYYRGKASRVYQILLAPEKEFYPREKAKRISRNSEGGLQPARDFNPAFSTLSRLRLLPVAAPTRNADPKAPPATP
jgi:hypothetical protein